MDTDRILAIAREAKALAGKVTGRYKFVPEASAPAIHCDGDRIAIGDIWTVPYRQDCGDPECDCHEIWERRDAQFKLFAHAGTHYGTLAEAVERMGKQRDELLVACQGVLENLKYNHGAGLGVAAIWKVKQAIENAQETPS
jgi:hypothetical protein